MSNPDSVLHNTAGTSTRKSVPHNDIEAQVIAAMEAAGIDPPASIIADHEIHRFGRKKAGWYVVHPDPAGAAWHFGNWRLQIRESGGADESSITPEEAAERKTRLAKLLADIEAEKKKLQASAAIEARQRWDRCLPAPAEHGYLKKKQINPCGTRVDGSVLLIPMRDIEAKIWSIQEISPDGFKHNQEDGLRKGCFFQIGLLGDTFLIGEGFSTCASLHMATGYGVISAGDAHNIEPVAKIMREKYPNARIVVCGDDDWMTRPNNTGKLAAEKAAKTINAVLAMPWFGAARPKDATDFNDEAKLYGLDEVRETREEAA